MAPARNDRGRLCGRRLGESPHEVELAGTARKWDDRLGVTEARRDVRKCPRCGWHTIYILASRNGMRAPHVDTRTAVP